MLNPATPLSWLDHTLDKLDLVLLMSVNPGLRRAAVHPLGAAEDRRGAPPIDGERPGHLARGRRRGQDRQHRGRSPRAGADTFVAGSAIFGSKDYAATIREMRARLALAIGLPASYTRFPVVAEARADLYTPLAVCTSSSRTRRTRISSSRWSAASASGATRSSASPAPSASRRAAAHGAAPAARRARYRRLPGKRRRRSVRVRARLARAPPRRAVPAALRFGGGLAGYFGYEAVRHIEKTAREGEKPDPLGTPDMLLLVSDELAVVDNVLGKLYLVVYADPREPECRCDREARLEHLRSRLAGPLPRRAFFANATPRRRWIAPSAKRISRGGAPLQGIHPRRRRHAGAGLAAHLARLRCAAARALPRAARRQPSPYMFYFDFGDHHVVGASPEILVRLEGDTVTLRPIAGTRPRGATPRRTRPSRESCSPTRRSAPST